MTSKTKKPKASKPSAKKQKQPKATAANKAKASAAAKPKAKDAKRMSGLDHAAAVLAKAKEPMNAKAITQKALAAGWQTKGATPHATLYAAMLRDDRFERVERGLWTLKKRGKR